MKKAQNIQELQGFNKGDFVAVLEIILPIVAWVLPLEKFISQLHYAKYERLFAAHRTNAKAWHDKWDKYRNKCVPKRLEREYSASAKKLEYGYNAAKRQEAIMSELGFFKKKEIDKT